MRLHPGAGVVERDSARPLQVHAALLEDTRANQLSEKIEVLVVGQFRQLSDDRAVDLEHALRFDVRKGGLRVRHSITIRVLNDCLK